MRKPHFLQFLEKLKEKANLQTNTNKTMKTVKLKLVAMI